jgi:hypothetical protein
MENIFEQSRNSKLRVNKYDAEKPKIKDLTREFYGEMKGLSQSQKINLLYTLMVGKKPDPNSNLDMRINRVLFEQKFGKKIKDTNNFMKGKKKFKWPFKWNGIMKKSLKNARQVLVIYLNAKGQIETPMLHPIYSSDMIIIRNKPYQVDPRAFWRLGKYQCLLIKEIDRRPVSNLDYDEIKARGDSTDSDEFIIKAAMQAIIGPPKKKVANRAIIIVIGILVILGVIFFLTK